MRGPGSAVRSPGTDSQADAGGLKKKKTGPDKKEKGQIERGGSLPEGLQVEMKTVTSFLVHDVM